MLQLEFLLLGIVPYINASIIIQLATTSIPSLEKLQKEEGEAGRQKISQITSYLALGWASYSKSWCFFLGTSLCI